jgi:hypothetical protein
MWAPGIVALALIAGGPAHADTVVLGQVNFSHTGVLCTSPTGGPTPSFVVLFGIGYGLPSLITALGGTAPFNPSETGARSFAPNDPGFALVAQAITNGGDEDLFTLVTLQTAGASVGVSSTRRESALPELGGAPDLAGAAVSMIRLVVSDSGAAPEACPAGQTGARISVAGRWEFWGAPAPSSAPTVALTPLACTTCRVGEFAQFSLTIANPGPARTVELKVASRFPDGSTIFSILDPSSYRALGAGEVLQEALPGITIPPGLPFGTYILEAALLEPQLGETLARSTFPAELVP